MIIQEDSQSTKLLDLVKTNLKVKVVKNTKNLGAGASRNIGLTHFKHTFLTFIDADDYWDKDFLSRMIKLQNFSECRVVFSGYRRYVSARKIFLSNYFYSGTISCEDILKGNPISCLTILLKPDKAFDLPKFGEIKMRNDLVFFYKALKLYGDAIGSEDILATYVMRDKSLSRNKFEAIKWQFYVYRKVAKKNIFLSIYYLMHWAFYGYLKYKN